MSSEAPLCLRQQEEHAEYQECEHNEPLGAWMGRGHSHQEMSPSASEESLALRACTLVRWIARAVGLTAGLRSSRGTTRDGQLRISISNTAVGPARRRAAEELARQAQET